MQAIDGSGNVDNATYQVELAGAPTTYGYDPNGNMTSDGVKTYVWDAENRLVEVKQGGSTLATFAYDGVGRRATKSAGGTSTSFVYDGAQFLEERPTGGTTKRYFYGLGIDRPLAEATGAATNYFSADHLGSIAQVTDAAGAPILTRQYDAWGNLLQGSAVSGYAFTGREWDTETGLYYYRARYYDPKAGRFISEDPIGFEGGLNLYAYVSNRPTRYTDPLGLIEGQMPPPMPGYDRATWTSGQWDNGRWWVRDPNGRTWTAHPEDGGHWRHWDAEGKKGGRWPNNSKKSWPKQKKLEPDQCETDPNGDAPGWESPYIQGAPTFFPGVSTVPLPAPVPPLAPMPAPVAWPWPVLAFP